MTTNLCENSLTLRALARWARVCIGENHTSHTNIQLQRIVTMTSVQFAYWLQGLFELSNPKTLDEKQTDLIKRHLNMVFLHDIDPSMGSPEHQKKLNELHGEIAEVKKTATEAKHIAQGAASHDTRILC